MLKNTFRKSIPVARCMYLAKSLRFEFRYRKIFLMIFSTHVLLKSRVFVKFSFFTRFYIFFQIFCVIFQLLWMINVCMLRLKVKKIDEIIKIGAYGGFYSIFKESLQKFGEEIKNWFFGHKVPFRMRPHILSFDMPL